MLTSVASFLRSIVSSEHSIWCWRRDTRKARKRNPCALSRRVLASRPLIANSRSTQVCRCRCQLALPCANWWVAMACWRSSDQAVCFVRVCLGRTDHPQIDAAPMMRARLTPAFHTPTRSQTGKKRPALDTSNPQQHQQAAMAQQQSHPIFRDIGRAWQPGGRAATCAGGWRGAGGAKERQSENAPDLRYLTASAPESHSG